MQLLGTEKLIVVGGGVLGASTAAHLARRGAKVTLVTAGSLADGASGRSIAWLNSSGSRSANYHYLRLLALDRYRTWQAQHPESQNYLRFDGALKWAGPGESLRNTFTFERDGGYDAVWIGRDDISRIAPEVDPSAVPAEGAIHNPGEGWVHLPDLIKALAAEAIQHGATINQGAGEVQIETRAGAVSGVRLADGTTLNASQVILATGASVPMSLAELGVALPDASPPAFVVITDRVGLDIRTVINSPAVAIRPTPDGRLVLDADWAERSIRVGADGGLSVPQESVQGLLRAAERVLAGDRRLTARRVLAGPKPIPGDGEPVAGAVASVSGLHALFTHSGATLGLILGELVAEEVLTGESSPVLAPFKVDRFAAVTSQEPIHAGAWVPLPREVGDLD